LPLRIGSRGSQLALWQANYIGRRLEERGHQVEIQIIRTTGDKILDVPLAQVGSKGLFTKEIEDSLAAREIDLAVHSLKDLPTQLSSQFEIAAIPRREDARDALCSAKYSSLEELPPGARIGTSSLRREAQIRALRPDLEIRPVRGNVDTRLRKLRAEEYDAIVLALAGLRRLERTELVREILPVHIMCPAAGQGALAVEIRRDDGGVRRALEFLDDPAAREETDCERALLEQLGGGCQVPIGAHAKSSGGSFELEAVLASPDGTVVLRESACDRDPKELGKRVAQTLLERGGRSILEAVQGREIEVPQQP
jgi:hydroxymethylbilane synthase